MGRFLLSPGAAPTPNLLKRYFSLNPILSYAKVWKKKRPLRYVSGVKDLGLSLSLETFSQGRELMTGLIPGSLVDENLTNKATLGEL
jgi:hypothetical protein